MSYYCSMTQKKVQIIWHFQLFLLLLHYITNYCIGIKIEKDE